MRMQVQTLTDSACAAALRRHSASLGRQLVKKLPARVQLLQGEGDFNTLTPLLQEGTPQAALPAQPSSDGLFDSQRWGSEQTDFWETEVGKVRPCC